MRGGVTYCYRCKKEVKWYPWTPVLYGTKMMTHKVCSECTYVILKPIGESK